MDAFSATAQRPFLSNFKTLQQRTSAAHAKDLGGSWSSCNGFVDWWHTSQFWQKPNFGMHLSELPRACRAQCFFALAIVCNPKAFAQRQDFVKDARSPFWVLHSLSQCCVAKQKAWWQAMACTWRCEKKQEKFSCYAFSRIRRLGNAKGNVLLPWPEGQERMFPVVQTQARRIEDFWYGWPTWKASAL